MPNTHQPIPATIPAQLTTPKPTIDGEVPSRQKGLKNGASATTPTGTAKSEDSNDVPDAVNTVGRSRGGKLSDEQKRYVVQLNACYVSPAEVVKRCREYLGIEIKRQNVENYDPTKVAGARLCPELCDLFRRARDEYHARVDNIGITHQVYRLYELQDIYNRLKERGALVAAMGVLEQAAKEVGGMFLNGRVPPSARGGTSGSSPPNAPVSDTALAEQAAEIWQLLQREWQCSKDQSDT